MRRTSVTKLNISRDKDTDCEKAYENIRLENGSMLKYAKSDERVTQKG